MEKEKIISLLRREVAFLIVGITGLITVLEYYTIESTLDLTSKTIGNWVVIIMAFTLMLATVRGYIYQITIVRRRDPVWPYAIYFMALVAILVSLGLWQTSMGPHYSWWYTWVFGMAGAGTTTLTAMWIVSAIFRTFRVRDSLTLAVVIGFLISIYGLVLPIGELVPGLPAVGQWFYNVPLTAGYRGIEIGVGVGAVYLGLRILLGQERGIFGLRRRG